MVIFGHVERLSERRLTKDLSIVVEARRPSPYCQLTASVKRNYYHVELHPTL